MEHKPGQICQHLQWNHFKIAQHDNLKTTRNPPEVYTKVAQILSPHLFLFKWSLAAANWAVYWTRGTEAFSHTWCIAEGNVFSERPPKYSITSCACMCVLYLQTFVSVPSAEPEKKTRRWHWPRWGRSPERDGPSLSSGTAVTAGAAPSPFTHRWLSTRGSLCSTSLPWPGSPSRSQLVTHGWFRALWCW